MFFSFIEDTNQKECKRLAKMIKTLQTIREANEFEQPEILQEQTAKLIREAQLFAMYTRDIPNHIGNMNVKAYLNAVYVDTFGISVEVTPENWLKITMPALLQRENGSPWFVREPLNNALEKFDIEYRNSHDGKPYWLNDAVMIFNHRFDKNIPERKQFDLDNFERNGIADSIVLYFLPDDRPKYVANFELSEPADRNFTEIYLVPQKDFVTWLIRSEAFRVAQTD